MNYRWQTIERKQLQELIQEMLTVMSREQLMDILDIMGIETRWLSKDGSNIFGDFEIYNSKNWSLKQ